jgi:uncharacterized membrane protein YjgN (DUF898 family)
VIVDLAEIGILVPILFYAGIFTILPLAIHGSYRYRMSRISWRGIRFGYRGDRNELIQNFCKWIFFTIITIGIYGPWMAINLRKYLLGNVRFVMLFLLSYYGFHSIVLLVSNSVDS